MGRRWWIARGSAPCPSSRSCGGPWPGQTHQVFREWAAARPGQQIFQKIDHSPVRPIELQTFPTRPGPSFFQNIGTASPDHDLLNEAYEARALHGPARHPCAPVEVDLKGRSMGRPVCYPALKDAR